MNQSWTHVAVIRQSPRARELESSKQFLYQHQVDRVLAFNEAICRVISRRSRRSLACIRFQLKASIFYRNILIKHPALPNGATQSSLLVSTRNFAPHPTALHRLVEQSILKSAREKWLVQSPILLHSYLRVRVDAGLANEFHHPGNFLYTRRKHAITTAEKETVKCL